MDERDAFNILKLVTDYLNKDNIHYMIVGGITLGYYGNPRTTQDIDILLILEKNKMKNFVNFLEKNDFQVEEYEIKMALKEKSHFTVLDKNSIFRIDIKGIYNDFDRESFNRRRRINFRGFDICINTGEDAIISKLMFGSLRDLNDAKSIILRQNDNLDYDYIEENCRKYNLIGKLKEIRKK
ncbi:hypothetical protein J4214_04495 [Candidatus Woesearchaeota archaeon]|nr:hypothetical protein [Candidatus Woesearchaeota archaeon]